MPKTHPLGPKTADGDAKNPSRVQTVKLASWIIVARLNIFSHKNLSRLRANLVILGHVFTLQSVSTSLVRSY